MWDTVSGLTPQGYLAIVGDRLIVPCGAQLPAFLDLKTGELQKYTMGWGGRLGLPKGCWFVAGVGKYLSHGGDLYDITRPNEERLEETKPGQTDYKPMLYPGGWTRLEIERANQRELDRFSQPVMTPDVMYESDQSIVARDLTEYTLQKRTAGQHPFAPRQRRSSGQLWGRVSPALGTSLEPPGPHQGRQQALRGWAGHRGSQSTLPARNRKSCGVRRSRAHHSGCWPPTISCSS